MPKPINNVPQVPEGTGILAFTDVLAKSGRQLRLYVSDTWQHRIWGLQVIVAVDKKDVIEGATVLPVGDEALGYVRAIWSNSARIDQGVHSFGEFAKEVPGIAWLESEAILAKHLEGRSYYGEPASRRKHEIQRAWERLWEIGLWRQMAWVEFSEVEKEARREGLALLMYPALAEILEKQGVELMRSGLLSPLAQVFWENSGCQGEEIWLGGEQRTKVKAGEFDWQYLKPLVKEPGEALLGSQKPLKVPALPEDVTLDQKAGELLEKLTPKKLLKNSAAKKIPAAKKATGRKGR